MLTSLIITMALSPTSLPQATTQTQNEKRYIRERTFQLKDLQTVEVSFNDKVKYKVWVMDTDPKRMEGMMFLRDFDFTEKEGMLFAFKIAQPMRFWMKNTYVPLDIAYLDSSGKVDSIYTMRAFDTVTDYSSTGFELNYALEVAAGQFKKHGIKVGDVLKIPPEVKAKD